MTQHPADIAGIAQAVAEYKDVAVILRPGAGGTAQRGDETGDDAESERHKAFLWKNRQLPMACRPYPAGERQVLNAVPILRSRVK